MKVIVAFDSIYGNTRKVAEYVAAGLISEGHQAELVNVRETSGKEVKGDMLFLGSPTRMASMTGKSKSFAKRLDAEDWAGKKAVAFDTIMAAPDDETKKAKALKWTANGAAPKLAQLLKSKGLDVSEKMLRVEVVGMKGPLTSNAESMVKDFLKGGY